MSRSGRVRVLIIGYRKFSELINAVMPEFEQDAEVTIVESVANANTSYHSLIERHAPDVVASAGSNAAYLDCIKVAGYQGLSGVLGFDRMDPLAGFTYGVYQWPAPGILK